MSNINVKEIMFETYREHKQSFQDEIAELVDTKFNGKQIPMDQIANEILMMVTEQMGVLRKQQMVLDIEVLQKIVDQLQNNPNE